MNKPTTDELNKLAAIAEANPVTDWESALALMAAVDPRYARIVERQAERDAA